MKPEFDLTGYLSETDYDYDPWGEIMSLMFDVAETHQAATGNTLDGFSPSPFVATSTLEELRDGGENYGVCSLLDDWHLDPGDDAAIADLWRRLENLRTLLVKQGRDY